MGKAVYVGISNYPPTSPGRRRCCASGECVHHPPAEVQHAGPLGRADLLAALRAEGLGCIAYSPLAQGLLTNRYLRNIPADSRAAKPHGALAADVVTDQMRRRIARLDDIARARGQSLAQLALVWVLRDQVVTSAIVGTSRVAQLEDNVAALHNLVLSPVELDAIDSALADT